MGRIQSNEDTVVWEAALSKILLTSYLLHLHIHLWLTTIIHIHFLFCFSASAHLFWYLQKNASTSFTFLQYWNFSFWSLWCTLLHKNIILFLYFFMFHYCLFSRHNNSYSSSQYFSICSTKPLVFKRLHTFNLDYTFFLFFVLLLIFIFSVAYILLIINFLLYLIISHDNNCSRISCLS